MLVALAPAVNTLGKIGTVLVAVVIAVAAAEWILRLEGWGVDPAPEHAHLLRYDETIGWTKIPKGSVVYRYAGRRIHETSNSFGGRGREPGDFGRRVLFLGDSFCEGYLVSDGDVFSSVLEKLEPGLAAINLGVAGYSTDQEYLLYQRDGARLNPQAVVLLFFDNDVWFNSVMQEYRARKPMFQMDGGALRLAGVPVPPPDRSIPAAPCADCPSDLRILQLFERARQRASPASAGARERPAVPRELQVYRRSEPAEIGKAWQLTEALLNRLREATGNRLAVFYVPTVAAVYDDSWRQTRELYGMDDGWDIHLAESRLAEICLRLAIPMLSPTWQFREQARRGKSLYFLEDGHWNGAGHRLAAEVLARYLRQKVLHFQ